MIEINNTPDLSLELNEEELQYMTLKYLYQEKIKGRDKVSKAEIMEYLGYIYDATDELDVVGINEEGIAFLKSVENRYKN